MKRISREWETWICDVLVADPTKDVSWDLGLAALPDPTVVGQFLSFMIIEVEIPSEPLTTDEVQTPPVIHTRGVLPPFAPREQVQQLVRELLGDLLAHREAGSPTTVPNVAQRATQAPGMDTPA